MYHFQEDEFQYKDFDIKIIRRLMKYIKPYRWRLLLSVVLLIITAGLELLGPIITKHAIDVDIVNKDYEGLLKTVGLFFVILMVGLITHFNQIYNTRLVGQKVVYDLRMEVFSHLQKMSISYYDRHPVGRLMTRVTSDVSVLDEMFSSGVVAIFGDIFTIVGIVIAMLILNWKLALVTFIVLPFVFYASFIFRKYVRTAFREIRVRLASINTFMNELIAGMAVTHLFGIHSRNQRKFVELNRDYLRANLNTIFYFALFFPTIELLGSLAIALIIGYGGKLVLGGLLTLGSLIAFLQYSERFFRPIRDLSEKYNILQNAMASAERIFSVLDSQPEISSPQVAESVDELAGRIEFCDVTFGYNKDQPILKNISFTLEPGTSMAIVGRTGAGKTTLINLLCRFYDPQKGTILVDGKDIRSFNIREWRRNIGLVQQDLFLFSGTIKDNICIDTDRTDRKAAREFASTVKAHDFIQRMPQGYSTPLGERGTNLSTGQRQLLAFARAISINPRILILDEATSSVDTETESLIQNALKIMLKGRTSIIIAHRLSTIKGADKIIVLHKGEIRETGKHRQLMAKKGIYYKLYKLQSSVPKN